MVTPESLARDISAVDSLAHNQEDVGSIPTPATNPKWRQPNVIRKEKQLGMSWGKASGRLGKDILFALVVQAGRNTCYRCKGEMTRTTFSIEHKRPWLDSEAPAYLFFDLNNIAFSHKKCNGAAARPRGPTYPHGTRARYDGGCRCQECTAAKTESIREWRANRKNGNAIK